MYFARDDTVGHQAYVNLDSRLNFSQPAKATLEMWPTPVYLAEIMQSFYDSKHPALVGSRSFGMIKDAHISDL